MTPIITELYPLLQPQTLSPSWINHPIHDGPFTCSTTPDLCLTTLARNFVSTDLFCVALPTRYGATCAQVARTQRLCTPRAGGATTPDHPPWPSGHARHRAHATTRHSVPRSCSYKGPRTTITRAAGDCVERSPVASRPSARLERLQRGPRRQRAAAINVEVVAVDDRSRRGHP